MLLRSFVSMFLCGVALAQTATADQDIPALLEQVMRNQREMNRKISEYTASNTFTKRSFGNKGELKEEYTEISENYQSSRRNVEVALSRNGKPFSPGKIEKERK